MEIDNITLLRLEAGTVEDIKNVLREMIEKNSQRFQFVELNEDNRRKKLWNLLFHHLERPLSSVCHKECLAAVRVLSRDKTDLESLMSEVRCIEILLFHAGLVQHDDQIQQQLPTSPGDGSEKYQTVIEAQKALCNLLYNSVKVQIACSCNKTMEAVIMRLRLFNEPNIPHDVKLFDIKTLFLITALSPGTRPKLRDELHGLLYLVEILDSIMKDFAKEGEPSTVILSANQVSIAVEVLKVLFNLTVKSSTTPQLANDEDDNAQFMRLELILKHMLLCNTKPDDLLNTLHSHVVNLLTTVPGVCHRELMSSVSSNELPKGHEFNGKNMEAVAVLLRFLDTRLTQFQQGQSSQSEMLCPILTVLVECARSDPILRKYLRAHILPPLRDVKTRPEQGDKLRNKLCRMLTCPITNVRDLSAELLFVICKESVSRMIKYTGYGNAAGMFADRGLLGCNRLNATYYSSDSEDSETEEYSTFKDRINPVLGCYLPPRPDPTSGMSEEQKEYEAVRLANMMDKLARDGLVQPCRIGEDGRPHPVEHVLQLQEENGGTATRNGHSNRNHNGNEDDDD